MYPTEDVSRALGATDFLHRSWSWLQSPIAQLAGRIRDRPLVPSPYVALRGAADNRGSGGTSRTDTRLLLCSRTTTETTAAARRVTRQGSDTSLELTLIVGSSRHTPGCDYKRLVLGSRTTFAITPASLLCVCDFTSPPTAGVASLTMSFD
jgi:hypothetical protein